MAEEQDRIRKLRAEIVDPLTLMMAIKSEGRCGTIQSFRCNPRGDGWVTRPQGDKWEHDFLKVANADRDEMVTLSDGQTQMKGLGLEGKGVEFSHREGKNAKAVAIKYVLAGKLRAPKNWDNNFSEDAGKSLEDLKVLYPALYQTTSSRVGQTRESEPIKELGLFASPEFEEIVTPTNEVQRPISTEEIEDEMEDQEETTEMQPERVRTYSVSATDEPTKVDHDIVLNHRPLTTSTIYRACEAFKIDVGDDQEEWVSFFRVRHPDTGMSIFIQEGEQPDYSNLYLTILDD